MISEISIPTNKRTDLIDITEPILEIVKKSQIKEGICYLFVPHTTAGITINENADPSVQYDILKEINKIAPFKNGYTHAEGNAAAHIKSTLIGTSKSIIIKDSKLLLGTWQAIFFYEFDGPRRRKVFIRISS